jgi:hypothetical protein
MASTAFTVALRYVSDLLGEHWVREGEGGSDSSESRRIDRLQDGVF